MLKPSNQYHLDWASHDADDSRPEGFPWYRTNAFEALVLMHAAIYADIARFCEENRIRYLALKEERELDLTSVCDDIVHVNDIAL